MEGRVNQTSRYGSIVAFSGREYVKYEWRPVPSGFEAEAERHPYLEVKAEEPREPEKQPVVEPVLIDPSDGISDAEASAAGKALAARKEEQQPPENAEQKPELKPERAEPKSSRRRK